MIDNSQIKKSVDKFCKILSILTETDEKKCEEIWDEYYNQKINIETLTNQLHINYDKKYVEKAKEIMHLEDINLNED